GLARTGRAGASRRRGARRLRTYRARGERALQRGPVGWVDSTRHVQPARRAGVSRADRLAAREALRGRRADGSALPSGFQLRDDRRRAGGARSLGTRGARALLAAGGEPGGDRAPFRAAPAAVVRGRGTGVP